MAVSLSKGSKISLEKAASDAGVTGGLDKIICGLGWDVKKYDGGTDFDLDASAFVCGADGKVLNESSFIFYKNPESCGVKHSGDNRTGAGDGDDETITITLSELPSEAERIAITVTIYDAAAREQNFGMVSKSYARIIDAATGIELCNCELGEDLCTETAVVLCELYKHNGAWKFEAVQSGFNNGLEGLCVNYGVELA